MVFRLVAVIWISVLLVSWLAEARRHNPRRTSLSSSSGEEGARHRHHAHHRRRPVHRERDDSHQWEDSEGSRAVSSDYESWESDAVVYPRLDRPKPKATRHRYLPSLSRFLRDNGPMGDLDPGSSDEQGRRDKRHNQMSSWSRDDLKDYNDSQRVGDSADNYEVEVRKAQNCSTCNYTVSPITNLDSGIPLENIKCINAGSRCQDKGTYYCTQTYKDVHVTYKDGQIRSLRVYTGCVCALRSYDTLGQYGPTSKTNY